jgi:hypothetical protein
MEVNPEALLIYFKNLLELILYYKFIFIIILIFELLSEFECRLTQNNKYYYLNYLFVSRIKTNLYLDHFRYSIHRCLLRSEK